MIELVKKTLLTGVGLAYMTKDKIEEIARELAKSAELSKDKGQEFVNEVIERGETARKDLEATVQGLVNDSLEKTNLATREDIDRLVARIEELEAKLAS